MTAQLPRDRDAVVVGTASPTDLALARAGDLLGSEPAVGIVFITPGDDAAVGIQRGHRWLRQAARQRPDVLSGGYAVVRRTVVEASGQREPGTPGCALSLWLHAAALADVGHVTAPRSRSPEAWPGAAGDGGLTALYERAHAFRRLFEDFAPMRGQVRLRSAVYRALARSARSRARVAAYDGDGVEASLCLTLAGDIDRWRRRR